MRAYGQYTSYLEQLVSEVYSGQLPANSEFVVDAVNGEASRKLHVLVDRSQLKSSGVFFTQGRVAAAALNSIRLSRKSKLLAVDPACGAGDLLLAVARRLGLGSSLHETLWLWNAQLSGGDVHAEFVRATRARLLLLAAYRTGGVNDHVDRSGLFPLFQGSAFSPRTTYEGVSHVLLNPPYCPVEAPSQSRWARGKVNSAAVFVDRLLRKVDVGTHLVCILPDVLRSGSRYRHWRNVVSASAEVIKVQTLGLFDSRADVHVFALHLTKRKGPHSRRWKQPTHQRRSLDQVADVRVGSLVEYREPKRGSWRPFLESRDLKGADSLSSIPRKRRYRGACMDTPFVAVQRTSRPDGYPRIVARVINLQGPVAVENHVITIRPHGGTIAECQRLLKALRSGKVAKYLNTRIQCRHLTVAALKACPIDEVT